MRYRDIERRLAALEAEAERQLAATPEAQAEATEAAWLAWYEQTRQELATATPADLLNRRPEELVVWAELHRPEFVEEMAQCITEIYAGNPLEEVWALGQEWYFDLCRLLGAPYQRTWIMGAWWPPSDHIYWPDDPLYARTLNRDADLWNRLRFRMNEVLLPAERDAWQHCLRVVARAVDETGSPCRLLDVRTVPFTAIILTHLQADAQARSLWEAYTGFPPPSGDDALVSLARDQAD